MNEGQARARLQRMVRASDEPTLADDDIDDLLLAARRPDRYGVRIDTYPVWKASGAYAVGDLIVPSVRNGHFYRVTDSDGQAGPTEPIWPTDSAVAVALDGVTYQEAGSAPWMGTWDLNWAAAEGWRQKAGKVAGEFTYTTDRQSFNRAEAHAMCERQSDYYRRKIVSTEPISQGWRHRYLVNDDELLP